jgi:DNA-binding XRE family transcriptional regulator
MVTNVNKKGGDEMKKKPTYPILAQLMAKHGMTKGDISKIINVSYRNTLNKLNGKTLFDIVEASKIVSALNELGENITIERIFFG